MTTILIVDDNHDFRQMLTLHMRKRGFSVATATNGREAIAAASEHVPSLILMDINMPELDGIEATSQLRSAAVLEHVPVIAVTAYASRDDAARALAAGCDAFHCKPIDFDRLFEQISDLLSPKGSESPEETSKEKSP